MVGNWHSLKCLPGLPKYYINFIFYLVIINLFDLIYKKYQFYSRVKAIVDVTDCFMKSTDLRTI